MASLLAVRTRSALLFVLVSLFGDYRKLFLASAMMGQALYLCSQASKEQETAGMVGELDRLVGHFVAGLEFALEAAGAVARGLLSDPEADLAEDCRTGPVAAISRHSGQILTFKTPWRNQLEQEVTIARICTALLELVFLIIDSSFSYLRIHLCSIIPTARLIFCSLWICKGDLA